MCRHAHLVIHLYDAPMMKNFQAKTFVEILEDHSLIPIFPAGETKGDDGRGPYRLKNPDGVIAASLRPYVDLVIDRDHQTDYLPAGTPIKAAGWIKEFVVRDGAIFARVEWTPAAAQELKDKEYRYISPTFICDKKTGEVQRILRATLTNTPNFNMKAVASAQKNTETENQTEEEENDPMNPSILAIAAALGLTAPKTEEEVVALVKASAEQIKSYKEALVQTAKALGLKEDEESKTIVETAAALSSQKKDIDASEFVPMSVFKETSAQLSALQNSITEEKATAAVEAAMKAGKVPPSQKEWATAYAKRDIAEFNKYVEGAPVVASSFSADTNKVDGNQALSDEDKAMCASLGISEDDFKKNRQ